MRRRHYRASMEPKPEDFKPCSVPIEQESENTRAVNARLSANGRCPVCELLEPHECLDAKAVILRSSNAAPIQDEAPSSSNVWFPARKGAANGA